MHRIGNVFSIIILFSIAFIHSFSLRFISLLLFTTLFIVCVDTNTHQYTQRKSYFICYIEMKLMPACVALSSMDCFFFFFFICMNVCMERIDGFSDESGCVFINMALLRHAHFYMYFTVCICRSLSVRGYLWVCKMTTRLTMLWLYKYAI